MTKTEFLTFIKSFKKAPGNFTDDEVYKICKAHKTLFHVDKNWNILAKTLGVPRSGEALRAWANRKMIEDTSLTPVKKELNGKPLGENTKENLDEQIEKLYVEQTKLRDLNNQYRSTLRDEARIDAFKSYVMLAASKIGAIKLNPYKGPIIKNDNEAILMLSDWHIGQESDNFYNKYNLEIAKKRVAKVVNDAIEECKLNKVKTLHVLNLGDLIEGVINLNARIGQTTDVVHQLIAAAELMTAALTELQSAAPTVTYRSVVDNHSRYFKDLHAHIEKENMNLIVDWHVKTRLKDSGIKFIDDNLDIGLGRFALENDMKVAFEHGHEGNNKNGALQEIVGATQEWTDIICMGHWHNPAEKVYQNMRLFVNGSLCGTGPYALGKRLFNKPSQKLIIIKNKNIHNIDINADVK